MKRLALAGTAVLLGSLASIARPQTPRILVECPGAALKWIRAAEPEFQRRQLNLDKYKALVVEERDFVMVSLSSPDEPKGARGSAGKYPGFEVEISKKNLRILRSNFVR
jgi:hypothetical protein